MAEMENALGAHYLRDVSKRFRATKELAERAIAQADDRELFLTVDDGSNSIAVIMKHMSGNMLSRWTDFLTTDGEKPGRSREAEFTTDGQDRRALLSLWEEGWARLFAALDGLAPQDLLRTVTIRGEPHTVVEAVNRQLAHYSQHTGQIVFLAKHLRGGAWQTLSIARGESEAVNEKMRRKHESSAPSSPAPAASTPPGEGSSR